MATRRTPEPGAGEKLRITITIESPVVPLERVDSQPKTWLRTLRETLHLTEDDFARMLDVSTRAVRRWEAGEKVPRRRRTIRILNAHARDHA